MASVPSLRFRKTVPDRMLFHIVRHSFRPRGGFRVHTHRDFAEVFWVESGTGIHRINGERHSLCYGSVVLVRPHDVHGFQTGSDERFTLVNLSFPKSLLGAWERRHFRGRPVFFWKGTPLPHGEELDAERMGRLEKWTDRLSTCPNDLFHLEWFLMDLFHSLLSGEEPQGKRDGTSSRLARALEQVREPRHFSRDVRHLAGLAGCSLQHLNRQLRSRTGKSAGQVLNQARIAHAARQLQLTDRPILEVCHDCGFNNLGHFYLQFKRVHGVTPLRFRRRQQRIIGREG